MCALLITSYSYIGDPIDCYEPQEFEDQWVEYMDNICWVCIHRVMFTCFNEGTTPNLVIRNSGIYRPMQSMMV